MSGFNLTEWAIRHKALAIYFMVVCMVAGVSAYLHLGRNEDPEFTVKTMVVHTEWPGATQEETMQQITDRIEKKLQDTPNLYYQKSYTTAGQSTIFVYLLESTPKKDVPDLWYQVRKKVGDIKQTLPQKSWVRSSMMSSATLTGLFMPSPRMASPTGNCATTRKRRARAFCE